MGFFFSSYFAKCDIRREVDIACGFQTPLLPTLPYFLSERVYYMDC